MLEEIIVEPAMWPSVGVALGLALGLAYLVSMIVGRLARALLVSAVGDSDAAMSSPAVRRPVRIIVVIIFILAAVALTFPALELAGIPTTVGLPSEVLLTWLFQSGLRIVLIGVFAYVVTRIIGVLVRRFEFEVSRGTELDAIERGKRARTLGGLIQNALAVLILGVSALMILRELRMDIMPILTGAGIVGLAVGFGAQTLVRDIIAGFFLILENQVRIGDVAAINGTGGLVEAINLRTIVLRDLEGTVHVFPNGTINTLSNRTKDFSFAVLDVGVAYKEDTDQVVTVLKEVASELMEDPAFRPRILQPLEVLGVEAFKDSEVTIRVRFKTVPLAQWDVSREFRRRIKKAFDARGIEIPFPHVSVYFGSASRPWRVEHLEMAGGPGQREAPPAWIGPAGRGGQGGGNQ
jgi:moderate conductance mechanosensitive channel